MLKRLTVVVFAIGVGTMISAAELRADDAAKPSKADRAQTAARGSADRAAPVAPKEQPSDAEPPEPPPDGGPMGPPPDGGPRGPHGGPGGPHGGPRPLDDAGGPPEPPRDGGPRRGPGEPLTSGRWPYRDLKSLETSDPEMYKLMKLDVELDRKSRDLAEQYTLAPQDQRDKIRKEVQQVVGQHFDVRQQRRLLELKRLKEELQNFENAIDRRTKVRKELIEKRVSDLLGSEDRAKF